MLNTCGRENKRKQRAKKVVSDSLRLVDFTSGLVNSVLNLPAWQVKFLRISNHNRTVINPGHHRASKC